MRSLVCTGMYCSGWVKRGPVVVIVSTMNDGFETGKAVVEDLKNGALVADPEHKGHSMIADFLKKKGKVTVYSHSALAIAPLIAVMLFTFRSGKHQRKKSQSLSGNEIYTLGEHKGHSTVANLLKEKGKQNPTHQIKIKSILGFDKN